MANSHPRRRRDSTQRNATRRDELSCVLRGLRGCELAITRRALRFEQRVAYKATELD